MWPVATEKKVEQKGMNVMCLYSCCLIKHYHVIRGVSESNDDDMVPIASSAADTPSPSQSVKEMERDCRYRDISVVLRKAWNSEPQLP